MKNYVFYLSALLLGLLFSTHMRAENFVTGNGSQGTISATDCITPAGQWTAVDTSNGFTMNVEVESNGASFNQWGSCILATGTAPFASVYDNGFQLYLQSSGNGGHLLCKTGYTEHKFAEIDYNENFSLSLDYKGEGTLTITATDAGGRSSSVSVQTSINSFSTLSYGLPAGINITSLTIQIVQTSLFDTNKKYTLRSSGGTYLNIGESDDNGSSKHYATSVFYSTVPSVFTITKGADGYVFQDENNRYIGVSTSQYTWNVDNTASYEWTVQAVDGVEGGFYISKSANNYLGNKDAVTEGTGIYTDQKSPILWYIDEYTNEDDDPITPVYVENPAVVVDMLDRIGGVGTGNRFELVLDNSLMQNKRDQFVITQKNGKPCIKGSSISAITTGVNWYLNHYAKVNLTWNNLTTDLSSVTLPLPDNDDVHNCDADYRYYLNYCTFGYSMTTWTWERWEKEIDWMALHGINMPLQIIGLEQVWKDFLMKDCGYTEADAEAFVPGPAYTAWWGMNNLEGWGGDGIDQTKGMVDDAWYARQVELARKILKRERDLGMEPVLPGFSGMMPSGFSGAESQGNWCGFKRPFILDPTSSNFADYASKYYARLEEVMGKSKYYSMDPFHEGGSISSGKYNEGYRAVFDAMNENCGTGTKWIIQQWQWAGYQAGSINAVPRGRLVVLDLFADGSPAFDYYNGYAPQEAIYCTIPNFGGRTGFFGRIPKMADNYFSYKAKYSTIKGVGAAPEAIEQTPVVYDLLFELPWMGSKPDCDEWMNNYVHARYGMESVPAGEAGWNLLLNSALNNTTTLQGPQEAIICGRPSLTIDKVSSWGGSEIFYDKEKMVKATFSLLEMGEPASVAGKQNYSYDLCDIARQTLTDYSKLLLQSLNSYSQDPTSPDFTERRDVFLQLILDIDRLLGTNQMFRLGNWTETARKAAAEVSGATTATADWYELNNARQLITTWGDYAASEGGGLRDYSYRQWQGILKDLYYERWKYWFDNGMKTPSAGWFYTEWNWAHETGDAVGASSKGVTGAASKRTYYTSAPEGNTYEIASELLNKYIKKKVKADGTVTYEYLLLERKMDDLWTIPTQNLGEMGTIESYKQYVNAINVSVNGASAKEVYSTSANPTTLYHHTSNVSAKPGDNISVSWTGNDGLSYCYVSAYIDSDGDGEFDTVPFATIGTRGAQSTAVCNGSVNFTVPTDITAPLTHIRLRFDSAWSIASSADDDIKRHLYEIPLVLPVLGDIDGDRAVRLRDLILLVDRLFSCVDGYAISDIDTILNKLLDK